jgi:hypothetical protein
MAEKLFLDDPEGLVASPQQMQERLCCRRIEVRKLARRLQKAFVARQVVQHQ